MEKPTEPDQKLVDRVLLEVMLNILSSDAFTEIVDVACLKVFGASTPPLRAVIKEAFKVRVGL